MADMKSRGGQKQEHQHQSPGKEGQGAAAPDSKQLPGHAAHENAREEYLKEVKQSPSGK
jgi:hypothetical protein